MKEYYENSKEDIKEQKKQYYDISKEKVLEPIKCDCGCMIARGQLRRHQRSKKHIELMKDKLN